MVRFLYLLLLPLNSYTSITISANFAFFFFFNLNYLLYTIELVLSNSSPISALFVDYSTIRAGFFMIWSFHFSCIFFFFANLTSFSDLILFSISFFELDYFQINRIIRWFSGLLIYYYNSWWIVVCFDLCGYIIWFVWILFNYFVRVSLW